MNNEQRVKVVLAKAARGRTSVEEIRGEHSLIKDYGMDSIQILGLIMALESEFQITFDDEDISFDVFERVQSLIDFVLRHAQRAHAQA